MSDRSCLSQTQCLTPSWVCQVSNPEHSLCKNFERHRIPAEDRRPRASRGERGRDKRSLRAQDASPFAQRGPRRVEVLDDEVRVDEVEGPILERQPRAEVDDEKPIECVILA